MNIITPDANGRSGYCGPDYVLLVDPNTGLGTLFNPDPNRGITTTGALYTGMLEELTAFGNDPANNIAMPGSDQAKVVALQVTVDVAQAQVDAITAKPNFQPVTPTIRPVPINIKPAKV
jgi:hypothetical protein